MKEACLNSLQQQLEKLPIMHSAQTGASRRYKAVKYRYLKAIADMIKSLARLNVTCFGVKLAWDGEQSANAAVARSVGKVLAWI